MKFGFFLMALEIIEWLFAIVTNIQRFACRGSKLTDTMCMI